MIVGKQAAVTDAAAVKLAGDAGQMRIRILNKGAQSAFLGGPAVTGQGGTAGFELATGVSMDFVIASGEALYARCATGQSTTLHALVGGGY